MQNAADVKALAREIGYAACGIAAVGPFEDYARALDDRAARFPEAATLYERRRRAADPFAANPWGRSLIVCIRRYGKYRLPATIAEHIARNYLCDRRSADGPDHEMPKRFGAALREAGLRVRRGGMPDRAAAARAGVAAITRNGFASAPGCGSWINIETYLVDADLEPDEPVGRAPCPEGCRRCIDACPTGAIVEPFVMRWDRCVAYLTYEAPEPVAPDLWERMGPWIYGCDACQLACPLNDGAWSDEEPLPQIEAIADRLTPEALAEMDDETYRTVIRPHFWYIPEDNAERWRRNARRAIEHATM